MVALVSVPTLPGPLPQPGGGDAAAGQTIAGRRARLRDFHRVVDRIVPRSGDYSAARPRPWCRTVRCRVCARVSANFGRDGHEQVSLRSRNVAFPELCDYSLIDL